MPAKTNIVVFTYHPSTLPLLNFLKKATNIKVIVLPANRDTKTLSPIVLWARKHHIAYLKTENCNGQGIVQKIKKIKPDLNVIFNFPQIFKKDLLKVSPAINFHPGDLPKYRGAHVLNWAIINGEKRIAVTCHFVDEGIDSGDIIAKKYLNISSIDDIGSLSKKVAQTVPALAKVALKKLDNPGFLGEKQDLEKSTYFKRRKPEDGQINWLSKIEDIQNLVRALADPWPGAFTYINGKKIIIDKIKPRRAPKIKAGGYLKNGRKIFFGATDGTVEVIKWR